MAKPFAGKEQDMTAPDSIDILLKMKIIICTLGNENEILFQN